jgi:hypothetical protein
MAFTPGYNDPNAFSKAVFPLSMRILWSDASGTYKIPVPANCQVVDIQTEVTEAFNGTGTTATLGDADVAAGYADATALALTTASTATAPAIKSIRDLGKAYAKGKRYPTAGNIQFAFTQGTTPTTGAINITAYLVNLRNLGVPSGAASSSTL